MKRNFFLLLAVLITILFIVNSTKRILSLRGTSQKVEDAERKLESLKTENEDLKKEFEYKKSSRFTEGEIRNKLGLAKEGETIVVVPKEEDERQMTNDENREEIPNWEKWRDLFFGKG
jgi:cell division protein FtsB